MDSRHAWGFDRIHPEEATATATISTGDPLFSPDKPVLINGYPFVPAEVAGLLQRINAAVGKLPAAGNPVLAGLSIEAKNLLENLK